MVGIRHYFPAVAVWTSVYLRAISYRGCRQDGRGSVVSTSDLGHRPLHPLPETAAACTVGYLGILKNFAKKQRRNTKIIHLQLSGEIPNDMENLILGLLFNGTLMHGSQSKIHCNCITSQTFFSTGFHGRRILIFEEDTRHIFGGVREDRIRQGRIVKSSAKTENDTFRLLRMIRPIGLRYKIFEVHGRFYFSPLTESRRIRSWRTVSLFGPGGFMCLLEAKIKDSYRKLFVVDGRIIEFIGAIGKFKVESSTVRELRIHTNPPGPNQLHSANVENSPFRQRRIVRRGQSWRDTSLRWLLAPPTVDSKLQSPGSTLLPPLTALLRYTLR
ncbi:hypothetical protein J6590_049599 [Homalodisca vitripennis]|nr:hypothetical protein J6590_049599 [Homalodisca vitripennis]